MKISKGQVLYVVKPNTSECPLIHCHNKMKPYAPLVLHKNIVASDVYLSNGQKCFDVIGDSGTKNKGKVDGTRKTYFIDVGLVAKEDRLHMECGGVTKVFFSFEDANFYIEVLQNEENNYSTYKNSLGLWGIPDTNGNISDFIKKNNELKNSDS